MNLMSVANWKYTLNWCICSKATNSSNLYNYIKRNVYNTVSYVVYCFIFQVDIFIIFVCHFDFKMSFETLIILGCMFIGLSLC